MGKSLSRAGSAADVLSGRSVNLYGGNPSTRVVRATREGVAIEQGRGLVQGARVQAVGYVAHTAVRVIEDLTDMEALALQRNPLSEARLKAIVDTATAACAYLTAETGR